MDILDSFLSRLAVGKDCLTGAFAPQAASEARYYCHFSSAAAEKEGRSEEGKRGVKSFVRLFLVISLSLCSWAEVEAAAITPAFLAVDCLSGKKGGRRVRTSFRTAQAAGYFQAAFLDRGKGERQCLCLPVCASARCCPPSPPCLWRDRSPGRKAH